MILKRKSVRVLIVPYLITAVILFLLSILQEVSITQRFNWSIICLDFTTDIATNTLAFAFFYYLLNKLYSSESKLLSSNNTLSETNFVLENFLYRASHDFRTPLTNIKGLLIAYELDDDVQSQKQYLTMLKQSTEMLDDRLLALTETTTIMHKIKASESIKITSLIKELIQDVSFTISLDKIRINIEVDPSLTIFSDTVRLKIMLRNILTNAVKYIDAAKSKHVINITVVQESGLFKLTFWDNGIGIPEDILPKIYEMFYRGTQRSNGAGLGLYIAKTIAISLGYNISVASKMGEWTEVVVLIKDNTITALQS
jgi:signal transduction histidine kinase